MEFTYCNSLQGLVINLSIIYSFTGEGQTFGELALIHPDCVRTASIVADEKTDLVVISRDLYNRSVSKVIAREYADKMKFIDTVPLFEVCYFNECHLCIFVFMSYFIP